MPHHKDAAKRARQNDKRQLRNRHNRTVMRTEIKKLRTAIDAGDAAAANAQLPKAVSAIQRVAQKGIIHRRQASRRVARLHAAVRNLGE